MATEPIRPEDVSEELTSIALDVWHAACHAGRTNLEAMTDLLTAVLPAHEAMVRAKVADEITRTASRLAESSGEYGEGVADAGGGDGDDS